MTGQHTMAEGLGVLVMQLEQAAREPSLGEPATSALQDVIALLKEQQTWLRDEPEGLARAVVRLAGNHTAVLAEGVRILRAWSEQGRHAAPSTSSQEPSGYVKSEAPGAAFLESDLEDGGNLSAVSGSSSVTQAEDVKSKHIAPG